MAPQDCGTRALAERRVRPSPAGMALALVVSALNSMRYGADEHRHGPLSFDRFLFT